MQHKLNITHGCTDKKEKKKQQKKKEKIEQSPNGEYF